MIYVGLKYLAKVQGAMRKDVVCERCGAGYYYVVVGEAEGTGQSMYFLDNEGAEARARGEAAIKLKAVLAERCEVVPCPQCGWCQADMVREFRRRRLRWMFAVGWAIPGLAALYLINHIIGPEPNQQVVLILSAIIALFGALVPLRWILNRAADPNSRVRADVPAASAILGTGHAPPYL